MATVTDERIKVIADKNGDLGVLAKLEEELQEGYEAVVEFIKDPTDPNLENHMTEELADAMITIEQTVFKFGLDDSFKKWREFKINRTLERMGLK